MDFTALNHAALVATLREQIAVAEQERKAANHWFSEANRDYSRYMRLEHRVLALEQRLRLPVHGDGDYFAGLAAQREAIADELDTWIPYPIVTCPQCGARQEDRDGFGVVKCECGFCAHPSRDDGVCGICGDVEVTDAEPQRVEDFAVDPHAEVHSKPNTRESESSDFEQMPSQVKGER